MMKKLSTLAFAMLLTVSVAACGTSNNCDYYPREHYEAWQEDCRATNVTKAVETVRETRAVRSFNRSLEK